MTTRSFGPLLLAGILVAGTLGSSPDSASAQRLPVPVTGRQTEVTLDDGTRLRGELIEATAAGLALGDATALQRAELSRVTRVRVRQHGFTSGNGLAWVGIVALASGLGMAVACSSVADASCGGVFPSVALSFALVGGLFAASMTSSGWREVAMEAEILRAYARFPQGAPAGFAPRP